MAADRTRRRRPTLSVPVGAPHEVVPETTPSPEGHDYAPPYEEHRSAPPGVEQRDYETEGGPSENGQSARPDPEHPSAEAAQTSGSRRTKRRKRRSQNLAPLKTFAKIIGLIVAVVVFFTAHGPLKLVFECLMVLGVLYLVTPFVLDAVKPKRFAPPDAVPERFVRGVYWKLLGQRLHARTGWDWLATRSKRQHLADNSEELWRLRWLQFIVVFCNKKGGSAKTAICDWLAALDFFTAQMAVLAFDVNDSGGLTAARLGVKRNSEAKDPETEGTIELRPYVDACEEGEFETPEALHDVLDWSRDNGVPVIASDAVATRDIPRESMRRALRRAKQHFRRVFADCGNNLTVVGNVVAVMMGHVLVFCGNSHMAGSVVDFNRLDKPDDLKNTMDTYTALGHGKKVKAGIIVIIGKVRDRKRYAEHYEFPLERVFVIPFNRYMKSGDPVALKKVPLRIIVVLSDILVAIVKAAKRAIDELHEAETETTTSPVSIGDD